MTRTEALRRIGALLSQALTLAIEHDADRGGSRVLIEGALEGTRRDLQREESRQLASAVYREGGR